MLKFKLIIIVQFILFNAHSQSFIELLDGEIIELKYNEITLKKHKIEYKSKDNKKVLEVANKKVKGYYSEFDNVYYYQIKNGFKKRILEGKINVYSEFFISESKYINSPSGHFWGKESYMKWYLEKNDNLFHFFDEKPRNSLIRYKNLKEGIFLQLMNDDSLVKKEFSLLKDFPKIKSLIPIIKNYNKRHFLKNNKQQLVSSDLSKVIVLRDNNKQSKTPLNFKINDKEYVLERNSKIEISIPNNRVSLLCITNDINNSCELISSSSKFQEYFELKLNKKGDGNISKINANLPYFKKRLAHYDKLSKKSQK